ncbi:MAG: hypothetical protein PH343_09430 [Nitrospira sp.]|nr:hypothetical protein [Nitrospira sp.]
MHINLLKGGRSISKNSWQDTIGLLRLVKNDYEGTRKKLEALQETISEREQFVAQRLAQALLFGEGYKTLCLGPVVQGITENRIGRIMLGETFSYRMPETLSLNVHCFERLEVYSNGKKLEYWQSTNAKSLFRLFITRPKEPLLKDLITEYLWPECNLKA